MKAADIPQQSTNITFNLQVWGATIPLVMGSMRLIGSIIWAQGFDVAAVDMRGSVDSQARDESGRAVPISISEFALDVDALIRALGYAPLVVNCGEGAA